MNSKKGDVMGLPFSVIFSIILIVFFIIAAIIAIKMFWNPAGCGFSEQSQQALYKQELQEAVNEAWNSDSSSSEFKRNLPGKITHVCFFDVNKAKKGKFANYYDELMLYSEGKNNFYLYPTKKACAGLGGMEISHLNISEITKQDNPYCKETKDGLIVEKNFYEALVGAR